ncbi:MAG: hypothetical protein WBE18_07250, partial [Gammaproteobacteria bacterium]
IKPVQKGDTLQPKPLKPALVLINKLKALAGNFFIRLLNLDNTATIKKLQEAFTIKEAAYKKASHQKHLYIPQHILRKGQNKIETFATKIKARPTLAFSNFFAESENNIYMGIVNHRALIEAIMKLNLKEKICNTSREDIEEILQSNNVVDANKMVTNDTIRLAIAPLILKKNVKTAGEETSLPARTKRTPTPDSTEINDKVSLPELRLYAAFFLLTQQHHYQVSIQNKQSQNLRSAFASHGQFKYRLLDEIQKYAKELVTFHTTNLKTAKRHAENCRNTLDSIKNAQLDETDVKAALKIHKGIYFYLEAVLTQFISSGIRVPSLPRPIDATNQNDSIASEQACYDYIVQAINSLNTYLLTLDSSLTVNEISKLAEQDKIVSKLLIKLGSQLMKDEKPAKPMDSLYSHKELLDAFSSLGVEKKLQNLDPNILGKLNIPKLEFENDNITSDPEIQIVTPAIIKKVVGPLLSKKPPTFVSDEALSPFSKACNSFENDVLELEVYLYTACILYGNPQHYKMWEKSIAKKPDYPFELHTQYHLQLIHEIKIYAKYLILMHIEALQKAKKDAQNYLNFIEKTIQDMVSNQPEGNINAPLKEINPSQSQPLTTGKHKLLERTVSKQSSLGHRQQAAEAQGNLELQQKKTDPNADIGTYLTAILRSAYQLKSGYTQHDITMPHQQELEAEDIERYINENFAHIAQMLHSNSDNVNVAFAHRMISKIRDDIEECIVTLIQTPDTSQAYISKLLQLADKEKIKATKAAEGSRSLFKLISGTSDVSPSTTDILASQPHPTLNPNAAIPQSSFFKPPPSQGERFSESATVLYSSSGTAPIEDKKKKAKEKEKPEESTVFKNPTANPTGQLLWRKLT